MDRAPPIAGIELSHGPRFTIGRWQVDPRADEIHGEEGTVKLEPLRMRLLLALAARPGEVLLTQELLDAVWPGVVVSQTSVYQGIAQLRRILGDDSSRPQYIETVPRKGYRLVAPVRLLPGVRPGQRSVGEAQPPAQGPLSEPADQQAATFDVSASPAGRPSARRRLLTIGAAAALVGAAVAGVGWRRLRPTATQPARRLAVLPFADSSSGQLDRALANGLSADLQAALRARPGLEVMADTSVAALGDALPPWPEIGRRLQAEFAVSGRIRRLGERVQVELEVHQLADGTVRSSRSYADRLDRLSALPSAMAADIAGLLGVAAPAAPAAAPSAAYELYALGQDALRKRSAEAVLLARDHFQRGIELDPVFAPNHIGLGWTWLAQAESGFGIDWQEGLARAQPPFDRALALAPSSPQALAAQATVRYKLKRFDEARQWISRALAQDPGYAQAYFTQAAIEVDDGWPLRATVPLGNVIRLDPLNASPHWKLASAQAFAGHAEAGRAACARGIALEPGNAWCHWLLGTVEFGTGSLAAAARAYRDALKLDDKRLYTWNQLAWTQLDLGLYDEADAAFARAAALLPDRLWPRLDAAFGWVARGASGRMPDEVALTRAQLKEDVEYLDVQLLRSMAGLSLDIAGLDAALDGMRSAGVPLSQDTWLLYHGHNRLTDLASLYSRAARHETAQAFLRDATAQLDRLERQGNDWHGMPLHRAKIAALQGDDDQALRLLARSIEQGCRRAWRLRVDPAFARLRQQPAYTTLVARAESLARQERTALGT